MGSLAAEERRGLEKLVRIQRTELCYKKLNQYEGQVCCKLANASKQSLRVNHAPYLLLTSKHFFLSNRFSQAQPGQYVRVLKTPRYETL